MIAEKIQPKSGTDQSWHRFDAASRPSSKFLALRHGVFHRDEMPIPK
jgi:hypothetical protein